MHFAGFSSKKIRNKYSGEKFEGHGFAGQAKYYLHSSQSIRNLSKK